MADQGRVIACDRTPSRLRKLAQNRDRLGLKSIEIHTLDSATAGDFAAMGDRVLLDVPCSVQVPSTAMPIAAGNP